MFPFTGKFPRVTSDTVGNGLTALWRGFDQQVPKRHGGERGEGRGGEGRGGEGRGGEGRGGEGRGGEGRGGEGRGGEGRGGEGRGGEGRGGEGRGGEGRGGEGRGGEGRGGEGKKRATATAPRGFRPCPHVGRGAVATTGSESGFNGLLRNVDTFVDSALSPQCTVDCTVGLAGGRRRRNSTGPVTGALSLGPCHWGPGTAALELRPWN